MFKTQIHPTYAVHQAYDDNYLQHLIKVNVRKLKDS